MMLVCDFNVAITLRVMSLQGTNSAELRFRPKGPAPGQPRATPWEMFYACMATILRDKVASPAIVIGGMPDHIHILCLLSGKFPIMAWNWMNAMRGIRVAPLGLEILAGRLPRALPWADIGLTRWAGTHGADIGLARWAGMREAPYAQVRWAGTRWKDRL